MQTSSEKQISRAAIGERNGRTRDPASMERQRTPEQTRLTVTAQTRGRRILLLPYESPATNVSRERERARNAASRMIHKKVIRIGFGGR